MISFDDAHELVRGGTSELLRECAAAIADGTVVAVHTEPGRLLGTEALATFRIRRQTSRAAGIEILGFDQLLEGLSEFPRGAHVLIFSFSGKAFIYSVFVDEGRKEIVGCLRIRRRADKPPSLKDLGLV